MKKFTVKPSVARPRSIIERLLGAEYFFAIMILIFCFIGGAIGWISGIGKVESAVVGVLWGLFFLVAVSLPSLVKSFWSQLVLLGCLGSILFPVSFFVLNSFEVSKIAVYLVAGFLIGALTPLWGRGIN